MSMLLMFLIGAFYLNMALAHDHPLKEAHYHAHDKVNMIANTVGPYNNPTETYAYYSLPFCEGTGKQRRHKQNLGETLSGSRKTATPYDLTFLDPVPWRSLCEEYLDASDLKEFKDAVEGDYFFEMFLDDLPMWGYIGEVVHEEFLLGKSIQGARVYLYPHLHFTLGYNRDQIVTANVTTDTKRRVDITDVTGGQEVVFSYSVEWVHHPEIEYENRMHRYMDNSFLPRSFEIHWLSIINSSVLVILLTAFLAVIMMRILKKDFSRYMEIDEEDYQSEEESGWKMIHGDVFRAPEYLNLFCAFVGSGAQIFFTVIVLLFCVVSSTFKLTKRGALLTAVIVIYCICAFFGGMVSGRLYKQLKGKNWVWTCVLSAIVFPVPLALVFCWVNTIAWNLQSTAALPFTTIMIVLAIFLLVNLPLVVFGSIVGRRISTEYKPPCRTNKAVREVPDIGSWYRHPVAQLFMAGFLPFSAIYIELHYIFASIWGHKIYTLFGILFLAFWLLVIVTSCITVALVYFQLARENHYWWWNTFMNGGATGLFIYAYSFFFYHHRSNMNGILQSSYYFGYTGIVAYAFVLMLGFVGFMSSFSFVNYIYGAVKTD